MNAFWLDNGMDNYGDNWQGGNTYRVLSGLSLFFLILLIMVAGLAVLAITFAQDALVYAFIMVALVLASPVSVMFMIRSWRLAGEFSESVEVDAGVDIAEHQEIAKSSRQLINLTHDLLSNIIGNRRILVNERDQLISAYLRVRDLMEPSGRPVTPQQLRDLAINLEAVRVEIGGIMGRVIDLSIERRRMRKEAGAVAGHSTEMDELDPAEQSGANDFRQFSHSHEPHETA